MATVRGIIQASLRRLGVLADGETPTASQSADGLEVLNALLDQWALDRLQIPVVLPSRLSLAANLGAYRLSPVTADAVTEDDFDASVAAVGVPDGWLGGGIAGIETSAQPTANTAPNLLRFGIGGSPESATIYRDVVCDAGLRCNISIWMGQNVSTGTGSFRIQNLDNDLYLSDDGTWGTTVADLFVAAQSGGVILAHSDLTFYLDPSAILGDTLRFSLVVTDGQPGDIYDSDTFSFTNYADLRERPVYIDHINYIDSNNNEDLEIPLQPATDDGWAGIRLKSQTGPLPIYYYYNPTFPYGTLHVWPVPTGDNVSLIIYAAYPITKFSSTTQTFYLPPGYERMIVTNLALELSPEYGAQPSPLLVQQAQNSMDSVKRGNVKMSDLSFDSAILGGTGRGRYDIRTG